MCGRFALSSDAETLAAEFDVAPPEQLAPRYNIAPSQPLLAVGALPDERVTTLFEWGLLPSWSKTVAGARRPINARAETVAGKPSFRAAFRRRRCLVPADGYYEWKALAGGKQPYYIHRADERCFAIAGIWEHWERDGAVIQSCALLTCAANDTLAAVHDRMPVIVAHEDYAAWLDPATPADSLARLLAPAADHAFALHAVSKRVNSPANDSRDNIRPVDTA